MLFFCYDEEVLGAGETHPLEAIGDNRIILTKNPTLSMIQVFLRSYLMFTHRTSSYFQENKNKFYIFALALGILFFLSGCKSAQLKTLENEVSIIQLITGREVSRSVRDKHAGFTGPIYAEILIQLGLSLRQAEKPV